MVHRGRHTGGGLPLAYVFLGLIVGAATQNVASMVCFGVAAACLMALALRRY